MEIKAKCKYDYETMKALTRLWFAGKGNPKTIFIALLAGVSALLVICLLEIFLFSNNNFAILLVALPFLGFLFIYFYFILPRIRYNAMSKLQNAETEFVFYDNSMKAFTTGEGIAGQSEIQYSLLVKAYETSKYIFIFQTKSSVFVVDKSTITDGAPEDIRNRLHAFLGANYYICKY